MAIQIGGITVPGSMASRGEVYQFSPPRVVRRNGEGVGVTAGAASLAWRWARLSQTEYDWWYQTVLSGLASKAISGATRLYNERNVETAFTWCVVHRPVVETVTGGEYLGVTLEITEIQ